MTTANRSRIILAWSIIGAISSIWLVFIFLGISVEWAVWILWLAPSIPSFILAKNVRSHPFLAGVGVALLMACIITAINLLASFRGIPSDFEGFKGGRVFFQIAFGIEFVVCTLGSLIGLRMNNQN